MKQCILCNSFKTFDKFKKVKQRYYLNTCKDCLNSKNREWQADNKDKIKLATNKWKTNNLEHRKNQSSKHKIKYHNDINYRIKHILRSRLRIALKNNQKSGSAISDLGCSIEQFKKHIESLWQPGMNWNNYGPIGWHIDHKEAISKFNLSDSNEVKKACHYSNLQPLWAADNLSKGAK